MSDNTSITVSVIAVCGLVITGIWGGCHDTETTTREAIRAGLVQKTISVPTNKSVEQTIWTKP